MCKASCSKIIESLCVKRGARTRRRVSGPASGAPRSCAGAAGLRLRPWPEGAAAALPSPAVVPGAGGCGFLGLRLWLGCPRQRARGGREGHTFPRPWLRVDPLTARCSGNGWAVNEWGGGRPFRPKGRPWRENRAGILSGIAVGLDPGSALPWGIVILEMGKKGVTIPFFFFFNDKEIRSRRVEGGSLLSFVS